ncbi:hypothetical protein [Nocardia vermiculata]|uniref:Uncharacterized protein n=1 Tax=Nocardia vermiculata TaxID=257274 RepID=A0A846Y7P3_9NOCA|nr:hypothetical protein [Nocardia vermiculata]NKY53890.1 hypothetical protein [Nocardia vermiculata]
MSNTATIEVQEYQTIQGDTAYCVTNGTINVLITPPGIGNTRWEVWKSDSIATIARTATAEQGIARARTWLAAH